MDELRTSWRGLLLLGLIGCWMGVQAASAQDVHLDYRYQPPIWHTPIGLPGDWHKPLVDANGALLYDFGPGPYARASTFVSVGLAGDSVVARRQTIDDPRVPIIHTDTEWGRGRVVSEAFSVVPRYAWEADSEWDDTVDHPFGTVRRINGVNSMIAWADPPGTVDPAFRNVAYGTNRPVDYRIRVAPGAAKTVVLGFADPYRVESHTVTRIMTLVAEGAEPQDIDVVNTVGQNRPAVVSFDAQDANLDGWLDVQVKANEATVDGNVFLSAIWVFRPDAGIELAALVRGELSDQAEVYIDCGRDPQLVGRGPRMDLLHAQVQGGEAVVDVRTKRDLTFDAASGALLSFGAPYIFASPRVISAEETDTGWRLRLPASTRQVTVAVSQPDHGSSARSEMPDVQAEKGRLAEYWRREGGLPWDRLTVPDSAVQALFDGSVRTLYQLTERIDGDLQTQPGPSVYRGLWVSNQPRVGRALTHLGDLETARSSFAKTFSYQQDDGRILVLTPPSLLKETGIAVHSILLHARMTRDRAFLERYWPQLERAADWILQTRKLTTDPDALNYGLMPAGLSDGGVGGIVPEYTTNYWSLLAVRGMVEGAQWLGRLDEAARYDAEFSDFEAAFRRAAARDVEQDASGNWFLPIRMEFDSTKHVPQRSQTQFSHMVYPGRLLAKHDPLVEANMKMLYDAPIAEGLTLSTGWLDNGLQPFIEATRAAVWLYVGNVEKAQQMLYAVGNHAAPTHVWVEEQLPGTGRRRSTGDVPHSSAASEFINLVRYVVAIEDGDHLDLLKGIPASWLHPGAVLSADGIPTEFGELTLRVEVSEDGREARIQFDPIGDASLTGGPVVHLSAFRDLGFVLPGGTALPDSWGAAWGQALELVLVRP